MPSSILYNSFKMTLGIFKGNKFFIKWTPASINFDIRYYIISKKFGWFPNGMVCEFTDDEPTSYCVMGKCLVVMLLILCNIVIICF